MREQMDGCGKKEWRVCKSSWVREICILEELGELKNTVLRPTQATENQQPTNRQTEEKSRSDVYDKR